MEESENKIIELKTMDFDDAVLEGTVLIAFCAEAFEQNDEFLKVMEDLKSNLKEKIEIYRIDTDEQPELADRFGIISIPSLGIFKDGKPEIKITGFFDLEYYLNKIEIYT